MYTTFAGTLSQNHGKSAFERAVSNRALPSRSRNSSATRLRRAFTDMKKQRQEKWDHAGVSMIEAENRFQDRALSSHYNTGLRAVARRLFFLSAILNSFPGDSEYVGICCTSVFHRDERCGKKEQDFVG